MLRRNLIVDEVTKRRVVRRARATPVAFSDLLFRCADQPSSFSIGIVILSFYFTEKLLNWIGNNFNYSSVLFGLNGSLFWIIFVINQLCRWNKKNLIQHN